MNDGEIELITYFINYLITYGLFLLIAKEGEVVYSTFNHTRKEDTMARLLKNGWIVLLVLASLFPFRSAWADTGPKPTMDFTFIQGVSGQTLTITSGTLFECDQSDCQDAKPLQVLGPQHFSCQPDHCSAMAYGFSPYHRLEIQFSDGVTRDSNVFKTAQFNSTYGVTIQQADLVVKAEYNLDFYSPYTYILCGAVCLIGVIVLVVIIILLVRRSRKK